MAAASIDDLLAAAASGPASVYGSTPAFNALIAARLSAARDGLLIVVTTSEANARDMQRDIRFFGPDEVLRIPTMDTSPYAELSADRGARVARMAAMFRLAHPELGLLPKVVVLSASALLRRAIAPAELIERSTVLRKDADIDRDATATLLDAAGYARAPVVEDPGTFAVRGGVLDVFSPMYSHPCRVELFGDTIESLRMFDARSQRTLREVDELHIHPVRETILTGGADPRARILEAADHALHPSKATRKLFEAVDNGDEFVGIDTLTPAFHRDMAPLWDYFAASNPSWLVCDPDGVAAAAADELEDAAARYDDALADHRIAFAPDEHFVSADELNDALTGPRRVDIRRIELLGNTGDTTAVKLAVDDNRAIRSALERARQKQATELIRPMVEAIERWSNDGWRVAITSDSANQRERLAGLLREYGQPGVQVSAAELDLQAVEPGSPPVIVAGLLSHGFALAAEQLVVLTSDDIFGPRRHTSHSQRRAAKRAHDALLGNVGDFSQLSVGDYLVHELHGVGQYKGLAKLPLAGTPIDFLHLEYLGGQLYLPVYRLNEVQRYVGAEGLEPRLDRLGGVTWSAPSARCHAKCAPWPRTCCSCMPSAPPCPATLSARPTPCSASSRPRSNSKRPRIRSAPSPMCWPTWNRTAPWTDWSAATWATARPRSPCAPRCARCWATNRWPCSRPPRCWSSNTIAPCASASRAGRCGWPSCRGFNRARPRAKPSWTSPAAKSTSSSAPIGCCKRTSGSRTWGC